MATAPTDRPKTAASTRAAARRPPRLDPVNLRRSAAAPRALEGVTPADDALVRELSPRGGGLDALLAAARDSRRPVAVVPAGRARKTLSLLLKGGRQITLDAIDDESRALLLSLLPALEGRAPSGRDVERLIVGALESGVRVLVRCDLDPIE